MRYMQYSFIRIPQKLLQDIWIINWRTLRRCPFLYLKSGLCHAYLPYVLLFAAAAVLHEVSKSDNYLSQEEELEVLSSRKKQEKATGCRSEGRWAAKAAEAKPLRRLKGCEESCEDRVSSRISEAWAAAVDEEVEELAED